MGGLLERNRGFRKRNGHVESFCRIRSGPMLCSPNDRAEHGREDSCVIKSNLIRLCSILIEATSPTQLNVSKL